MGNIFFPNNPPVANPYDVVIYGGTISGINAAWSAAMQGCKVALLEPTGYLGGMMGCGGLISHDVSTRDFGGLNWHQWKAMARAENQDPVASGNLADNGGLNKWPGVFNKIAVSSSSGNQGYQDLSTLPGQLTPQPKTAYAVLNQTLLNALPGLPPLPPGSVSVFTSAALQSVGGPVYGSVRLASGAKNAAITALVTNAGTFFGKVFIDASYEGDVMAAVANNTGGTAYMVGRESESPRNLGGFQPDAGSNSFHSYAGAHYPVLDAAPSPLPATGSADGRIQTMNFRASLIKTVNGGLAFQKPAGYTTELYQQFQSIVVAVGWTALSSAITLQAVCGNKYCMNDGADIFTMVNQGAAYPDGTPTQRAAIVAAHKLWYQGLLYFAANDIVGANTFKTDAASYGLSPDEFVDNGNWPYQIYVREGRRMTGAAYVMNYGDCPNNTSAKTAHSICKGTYVEDSHACSAYANSDNATYVVEGKVASNTNYGKSVQIPMETLYPAAGGCTNLLVSVCHGVSHLAWTCLRTEFLFGMMGEATGLMAARVAKFGDPDAQDINYTQLTNMMNAQGMKF